MPFSPSSSDTPFRYVQGKAEPLFHEEASLQQADSCRYHRQPALLPPVLQRSFYMSGGFVPDCCYNQVFQEDLHLRSSVES